MKQYLMFIGKYEEIIMDTKTIILICICVLFVVLSGFNMFKFIFQQNSKVKEQLSLQNKDIIFINGSHLNIKEDCYPSDDFFKMHNTGKNPREQEDSIKYIRYTEKSDFYI